MPLSGIFTASYIWQYPCWFHLIGRSKNWWAAVEIVLILTRLEAEICPEGQIFPSYDSMCGSNKD